MMEKLLEMASRVCDQVEIYSLEEIADGVSFENAKLKEIDSTNQCGLSLRMIKDGKLGFAYTKNLMNREELLQNAMESLKGGVEGLFDFPFTERVESPETYDVSVETLSNTALVEECQSVCEQIAPRTKGQVNVSAYRAMVNRRIINSRGTGLSSKSSAYSLSTDILFPGSYSAIHRRVINKKFVKTPHDTVQFLLDLYNQAESEAKPKAGKMKVLFLPETVYTLIWRLQSAANGKNIYQKVSPLMTRMNEEIFDKQLTIYDDPLDDRVPWARGFDDEGVSCRRFPIVEKGTLKNFYYDLFYGKKMGTPSTGHGYKSSMWGGETVSFKPFPSLSHLFIQPGRRPLSAMIATMEKGVIVAGALGAHSGNILNGDYSIGLAPGLYVEDGNIVGHVKDAMVAGNIFDTMKRVVEIENEQHPGSGGMFPAILFEDVSIATMR
jgi:PmbA protein